MRRNNLQIVVIVQARMGSTRLPGKILKQVLGKPLIQFLIERLERIKLKNSIIVATTTNSKDDILIDLCKKLGISTFRGSEEDVLERFFQAATQSKADVIVRICADSPLLDPLLIDEVIEYFLSNSYDYVTTGLERTFPLGMDVEVFSMKSFQSVSEQAKAVEEREHVTPFYYRHPELFRIGIFKAKEDYSKFRWTVDTIEDFEVVSQMLEMLYASHPEFSFSDIIELAKNHPKLQKINSHIQQRYVARTPNE